jgi:hypothetical protein
VVRHDDEGVKFIEALDAVVLEGVDEELGVCFDLEEAAAVMGDCGDEKVPSVAVRGGVAMGIVAVSVGWRKTTAKRGEPSAER